MAKETYERYCVGKLKETCYVIKTTTSGLFTKTIKKDHFWYVSGYFHGLGFFNELSSICNRNFVTYLNQRNYMAANDLRMYMSHQIKIILQELSGLWPISVYTSTKYNGAIDVAWLTFGNFNGQLSEISNISHTRRVIISAYEFKEERKPTGDGVVQYYQVFICKGDNTKEIIINDCEHGTLVELIRLYYLLELPKMTHHCFFCFNFNDNIIERAVSAGFIERYSEPI